MESEKSKNIFESFNDLSALMNILEESGSFSLIEKDLVLEKLRKLYDIISRENIVDSKVSREVIHEKQEIPEFKKLIIDDEPEEQETEKITTKPEKEEESDETYINNEEIIEEKQESSTLGERYQGSKQFMSELISKQHPAQDISVKIQSKPVEDIGKAIGLNDKFLFINELFKGDSSLYKKTVDFLNNSSDFNDAFNFLNDHFKWEMKNETVQKFMEVVRRKFIQHKNE